MKIYVNPAAPRKARDTFQTLEAARDALRQRKRNGPVEVLIAPGFYRLERPLRFGPEDDGVTWRGHGGRPVISGGREITGWAKGTINGRACWQVVLPEVKAGRWWFTQLFVNGRRRLRARLPKQGFYRFTGVPEAEAKADSGDRFHAAMSACFAPGEVRNFQNQADIDVVVPDHWYENHLRIASIDEAAGVIHFATKGHSRFSKDETGGHTRFRLDHVVEACTEPGDWVLERASGRLSYIPMPGEDLGESMIEAPVLDLLLEVRGERQRFEFLDFRHTEWELPRENAGSLQAGFNVPAAVRFVGATDCVLQGCRVSQVAGWGVEVLRGCQRNRIVGCALHDLGGGGVKIGHEAGLPRGWVDGDHGAFRGMDAEALGWGACHDDKVDRASVPASATTVSDCSIHDGGIMFHSAIGVWIGDASRNRVVHNRIFNFNYTGTSCGWNWGYMPAFTCDNRIEGNHISGIGHGMLSDMGAIYTLGRQAGSTIARNFIHDVHSYGYGGWGIYTDEGTTGIRIEENVVVGTKCGGFHQHYGRDNLVRRNLFANAIESQLAITRCEMVRPLTFESNVVQGAGNGALWSGMWNGGWDNVRSEGNVYAAGPGREPRFGRQTWAEWQAAGRDKQGRLVDAMLFDADGAAPAVANPEALRAAGMTPKLLAQIMAEAGPRFRGEMPATVPAEPERRRPIVEVCFWPWRVGEETWRELPKAAEAKRGVPQPVALTLWNRGDAPARGHYRLRVVPANAARIVGSKELKVALKPGERTALEVNVVATGKAKAFRVEAVAEGREFHDSCLFWETT